MSLRRELYGMPRLVSKFASTSSRVESPNKRNPKKLVIMYTEEQRANEVRTTGFIREESSSSLPMECTAEKELMKFSPFAHTIEGETEYHYAYYRTKLQRMKHISRSINFHNKNQKINLCTK